MTFPWLESPFETVRKKIEELQKGNQEPSDIDLWQPQQPQQSIPVVSGVTDWWNQVQNNWNNPQQKWQQPEAQSALEKQKQDYENMNGLQQMFYSGKPPEQNEETGFLNPGMSYTEPPFISPIGKALSTIPKVAPAALNKIIQAGKVTNLGQIGAGLGMGEESVRNTIANRENLDPLHQALGYGMGAAGALGVLGIKGEMKGINPKVMGIKGEEPPIPKQGTEIPVGGNKPPIEPPVPEGFTRNPNGTLSVIVPTSGTPPPPTNPVSKVVKPQSSVPPQQPPVTPPPVVTPPTPPKPPRQPQPYEAKIEYDKQFKPVKKTTKGGIGNIYRAVQEFTTDATAGLNKLSKQTEIEISFARGATKSGLAQAKVTFDNAANIVKDIEPVIPIKTKAKPLEWVADYLQAVHDKEVVAAKGPQRQVVGGYKGIAELDEKIADMAYTLGPVNFSKVQQAAKVVTDHYANILHRKVVSGLITPELETALRQLYPNYIPQKVLKYIDAESMIASGRRLSVDSNTLKKLTELGTQDVVENPFNNLARTSMEAESAIRRNDATKSLMRAAFTDPQLKPQLIAAKTTQQGKSYISFMHDGTRRIFEVPRWMEREAKALNELGVGDIGRIASAVNSVSRSGMTGLNVAFFIPNMARDALTAFVSEGVLPPQIAKRIILNLKDAFISTDKIAQMAREGGVGAGFWDKTAQQLAKEATKGGNLVLHQPWTAARILKSPLTFIEKVGLATEMGPRTAVFENYINRGKGVKTATMAANRATVDFSRAGTGIREANNFYLYLNAGLQGTLLPFRALRDNPMARLRVAGVLAGAAGIYQWNRQFPEYKDIPDTHKYGTIPVMLPSDEYDKYGHKVPHYVTIVPNLSEWAIFVGSLNYILSKVEDQNPEDLGAFLSTLAPIANPLSNITGGGQSLPSLVPTQLGSTLTEIAFNKDAYYNREIIPDELVNKPKTEQYNKYTSLTAKQIGEVTGQSPMQVDYFIKNVFGGLGQQVTSAIDNIIKEESPPPDPRMAGLLQQLEAIKPPAVDPENIDRARQDFLYTLDTADRKTLLELEKTPQVRIPIVSTIGDRLYKTRGGQTYRTGQALAEQQTGISSKQSSEASKVLAEYSDKMRVEQDKLDSALTSGQINWKDWKKAYQTSGDNYRTALLMAGIMFPGSIQAKPDEWDNYLRQVHTMVMTMPDTRSRADLVLAGYRAIQPIEIVPGKMDWDTFYNRRDAYIGNLIPEDQATLQADLTRKMTKVEKEYAQMQAILKPYWGIESEVLSQYPPNYKDLAHQITLLEDINTYENKVKIRDIYLANRDLLYARKMIDYKKLEVKYYNPQIKQILDLLY
jgi:hypothetical protein